MKLVYSQNSNNNYISNKNIKTFKYINKNNPDTFYENVILQKLNRLNVSKLKSNNAFKLKLPKINSSKSNSIGLNNNNNLSAIIPKNFFENDIMNKNPNETIRTNKKKGKSIFTNSIVDNALGSIFQEEYEIYEDPIREFKFDYNKCRINPEQKKYYHKINNNIINFENEEDDEEEKITKVEMEKCEEDFLNRLNTFSSTSRNLDEEKNKANVFNKVLRFEVLNNNKQKRIITNFNIEKLNIDNINNEEFYSNKINDINSLKINTKLKTKLFGNDKNNTISSREFNSIDDNIENENESQSEVNQLENNPSVDSNLRNSESKEKLNYNKNINNFNRMNFFSKDKINKSSLRKTNSLKNPNEINSNEINEIISHLTRKSIISIFEKPFYNDEPKKNIHIPNKEFEKKNFIKKQIQIETGEGKKRIIKRIISPNDKQINLKEKVVLTSNPNMVNSEVQTIEGYCSNISENKDNLDKASKGKMGKNNMYKSKNGLKNIFIKYSREIEM